MDENHELYLIIRLMRNQAHIDKVASMNSSKTIKSFRSAYDRSKLHYFDIEQSFQLSKVYVYLKAFV